MFPQSTCPTRSGRFIAGIRILSTTREFHATGVQAAHSLLIISRPKYSLRLFTHATEEVHNFFFEFPHFRRLRHVLLDPKTDLGEEKTATG